ncbi:hypothetical protein BJV82DRAFT_666155 [Fennellomyces sp. T-0311]|nr:hypothetical protein BJV82DRAFT_666155 [Fennellomyces sp. T-0311]
MHPALIVLIVVSVPLGAWAAYEGAEYLREWWSERQERKQYEEFVRTHSEKQAFFHDELDSDDDEPLATSVLGRAYGELRHRRNNESPQPLHSDYELSHMEKSIMARRERIAMEQAKLQQDEMDLQRRRQSLQSRGNSLMGMPMESSVTSLESNQTARHWNLARPPSDDLGPRLGPIEAADWDAVHRSYSSDSEDDMPMRMPQPHSRHVSESEESWADVHERMHSGTSYNSMRTPSGPNSYGVRSISSNDSV